MRLVVQRFGLDPPPFQDKARQELHNALSVFAPAREKYIAVRPSLCFSRVPVFCYHSVLK
jgi:hypothetical protein